MCYSPLEAVTTKSGVPSVILTSTVSPALTAPEMMSLERG